METDDAGSPVVVVVVRCPAEPIQQEEKGCRVKIGRPVRSQQSLGFHLDPAHDDSPNYVLQSSTS